MPAGRKRKHPIPERYPRIDSYKSDEAIQGILEEYSNDAEYLWYNLEWDKVLTPLGGLRRYFLCPRCGKRCKYLYLVGDFKYDRELQCGECAEIGYGSKNRSKWYNVPDFDDPEPELYLPPRARQHKKNPNRRLKAYKQMAITLCELKPYMKPIYLDDSTEISVEVVNGGPIENWCTPELLEIVEKLKNIPFCEWPEYFLDNGYALASFGKGKLKLLKLNKHD